MREAKILILARPTPGDPGFYLRWDALGEVITDPRPGDYGRTTILVVDQSIVVDDEFLKFFPRLKIICSATTGHTHLKFDAHKKGITLITLRGETHFLQKIRSVAEFTMLLMLMLSRPLSRKYVGTTLHGKILGIIGAGRIGTQVAALGVSFGMRPLCFDLDCPAAQLEDLFRESDFISIHASENYASYKMVNKKLIGLMKPTAFLINTARGSIIDEQALADALNAERIAGAAIDTVEEKKILNPQVKNLIVTPHIGGFTIEDRIKTDQFIIEKLKKEMYAQGLSLRQDAAAGYIPSLH